MTDPFRARTKPSRRRDREAGEVAASPAAPSVEPAMEPAASTAAPSREELQGMSRAQLAVLAAGRGLDVKGSKADLVARLAP